MSSSDYQLIFYNAAGVKQALITDFLDLAYIRRTNAPGVVSFKLKGDHSLLSSLADKWEVEVWRRSYIDQIWRQEIVAQFRDEKWTYPESGSVFEGLAFGIESLLGTRIVNWHANQGNRTKFLDVASESIMKILVNRNIGSTATVAQGRKREGNPSGITITTGANLARGAAIDYFCFGENLLSALQEISTITPGDFALSKTGANTYLFEFYYPHFGTDKSADITFAIDYGNMGNPRFNRKRSTEKTVAAVWGQGPEASRKYVTVTGANYSTSNDIEVFVDAKDVISEDAVAIDSGLIERGSRKLNDLKSTDEFEFEVLQTPTTQYSIHYNLGDIVSAINPFNNSVSTLKVNSVSIHLEKDGKEKIDVTLGKLIS